MAKSLLLLLLVLILALAGFFAFHYAGEEERPDPLPAGMTEREEGERPSALTVREGEGPGEAGGPEVERRAMTPVEIAADGKGVCHLAGRVVDSEGIPLAGAGLSCRLLGRDQEERWTTTSAGDGSWHLAPQLDAAAVALRVKAAMAGRVTRTRIVRLSPGERVQVDDFVLPPAAVVAGVVRDEAGRPVAEASVSAGLMGGRESDHAVRSDDRGRYRLEGLQPGRRRLTVDAEDFALAFRQVELAAGPVPALVDFTLSRGLFISGRVVGAGGSPVAGAKISLVRASRREDLVLISQSEQESRETDEEGRFRIPNLEKGSFRLDVRAEGWLEEVLPGVEAGTQGLEVKLVKGSGVYGRLLLPGGGPAPSFTVKRVRESPSLSGRAEVAGNFFHRARDSWEFEGAAGGRFEITGLRAGRGVFLFIAPGHPPLRHRVEVIAGRQVDLGTLRLSAGAAISVQVVDGAGRPLAGASIQARTAGAGGAGEQVLIEGKRVTRSGVNIWGGGKEASHRTDESGRCLVAGLAPGSYDLSIHHEDYAPQKKESVAAAAPRPTEVKVVLQEGGTILVTLLGREGRSPAGQSIFVEPAGTDLPIHGRSRSVQTDPEGKARIDHLAPGDYKVGLSRSMVTDLGGGSMRVALPLPRGEGRPVRVRQGGESRVELQLPGRWHLAGYLEDALGPVAGGKIDLALEGLPLGRRTATTGADGRFHFADVQPGVYFLNWGRPDCAARSRRRLELDDEGGRWERTLAIPSGVIAGRVLQGEDLPAAGLEVRLARPAEKGGGKAVKTSVSMAIIGGSRRLPGLGGKEREPAAVVTDGEGNYRVKEVPPGRWILTVHRPDRKEPLARRTVAVAQGKECRPKPILLAE